MQRSQGKSRNKWRRCQICKSVTEPMATNPMVNVCDCATQYIHYDCQAKMMTTSGLIRCDKCTALFVGIRYEHSSKSFFQYIWDDSRGRNSFLTTVSMVISMFFTVATLVGTFFVDLEDMFEELLEFQLPISIDAIKHDLPIIMMWNMKLFLPLLSIFYTLRSVYCFVCEFLQWQQRYFNIITLPPLPPSSKSREGKNS